MLSGSEFAAGAAQLEAAWRQYLPAEPPWRWVPARQSFAAAMGGGYLSMQHSMGVDTDQWLQQAAGTRGVGWAGGGADADAHMQQAQEVAGIEELKEVEEEADPADARQQQQHHHHQQRLLGQPGQQLEQGQAQKEQQQQQQQHAQQVQPQQTQQGCQPVPDCSAAGSASATRAVARLVLTCHIAFHLSYRVPVLYFEAVDQSGAPLRLQALLACLPGLRAVAGAQPAAVVTQEEHPFLHRPFFMLHPCQTGAIMELLLAGSPPADGRAAGAAEQPASMDGGQAHEDAGSGAAADGTRSCTPASALPAAAPAACQPPADRPLLRYLVAWLSVAGQPLGLTVPAQLCTSACNAVLIDSTP